MTGRQDRIAAEARGLWAATHHGPPPQIDGQALLDLILREQPPAQYEGLCSPHLRQGAVVGQVRRF